MNERIYWIDWLKVFTMILVVYAHVCSNAVVTVIFSFHMPLFFMISGYLHKQRQFKDELNVSFKTLIIPYYILTFVFLFLHIDSDYKHYVNTALCSLEQAPFYIRPMWFVFSLAIIRIVTSVLKTLKNCVLFSFILIVIFSLLWKNDAIPYEIDVFQFYTTLLSYPFFIMGKIIAHNNILLKLNKASKILIWILSIPAIYLAIKNGQVNLIRCQCGQNLLFFYLNAIVLSLGTFILFAEIKQLNRHNYYIEMTAKSMIIILAYQYTAICILKIFIDGNSIIGSVLITAIVMIVGFFLSQYSWKKFPILFGK